MEDPPRRSSPDGFAFSLRIDVGKTSLELALRSEGDIIARTTVPNDQEGHNALVDWLFEQGASPKETCVCMEASGDFEKAVARRLYQEDHKVSAQVRGESRGMRRANCNLRRPTLLTQP
ncbi:IS110 family transposase [Salinibacter ruber]|jgi:transposase|uniref:IS110 family transposase n=1 Tax=Salinibacter ruber TaxID=146919 RepID=UPI00311AB9B5